MSKKKKYQGTIYKPSNCNRLYIKYRSVRHPTGLPDTKENRKICEELLMLMWKADHGISVIGIQEYMNKKKGEKKPTFLEAYSNFENERYVQLTEQTKTSYESAFKYVITNNDYLKEEVSTEVIREGLIKFQNTNYPRLKPVSRRSILTNFRVFHKWLSKRYKIEYFNTLDYAPKKTKKPVQTYTPQEYQKLLEYWDHKDKEFAFLIRFMLLTGFRITETLDLSWNQIKANHIEVVNKTNKNITETFPLFPQLQELLSDSRQIFNNGVKVFRWSAGSVSSLRALLNRSFKECGIEKDGRAFHVFRKTFSSQLIASNTNVAVTKTLMRHKDISTTIEHYTQVSSNSSIEALKTLTKI